MVFFPDMDFLPTSRIPVSCHFTGFEGDWVLAEGDAVLVWGKDHFGEVVAISSLTIFYTLIIP